MKRLLFVVLIIAGIAAVFNSCKKNKDATPPVITLIGDATVNACQGFPYTDAGATAMDDTDGDISALIEVVNNVNTDVPGTYTVTYKVKDNAGNEAEDVVRTVIVIFC